MDFLEHASLGLNEQRCYGVNSCHSCSQEAAYIKIHAEIPEVLNNHAKPVNTAIYPTWQRFMEAFLSQGSMILIYNFRLTISLGYVVMAAITETTICWLPLYSRQVIFIWLSYTFCPSAIRIFCGVEVKCISQAIRSLILMSTVKCRYNAVFGVQEIDRVIAVTAL